MEQPRSVRPDGQQSLGLGVVGDLEFSERDDRQHSEHRHVDAQRVSEQRQSLPGNEQAEGEEDD